MVDESSQAEIDKVYKHGIIYLRDKHEDEAFVVSARELAYHKAHGRADVKELDSDELIKSFYSLQLIEERDQRLQEKFIEYDGMDTRPIKRAIGREEVVE